MDGISQNQLRNAHQWKLSFILVKQKQQSRSSGKLMAAPSFFRSYLPQPMASNACFVFNEVPERIEVVTLVLKLSVCSISCSLPLQLSELCILIDNGISMDVRLQC